MDIEIEDVTIDKPERTNLNLTENEFRDQFPATAKLTYSSLQKNRIEESINRTRVPAVSDFIRLAGLKGSIETNLQGLGLTIKAGLNKHIVPSPEHEAEVKKAYGAPYALLKEALENGVAKKKEQKDFNIVFHKAPKVKTTPDNSLIENLLENAQDQNITLSSQRMSEGYPTLTSSIHCQIQKRKLEASISKKQGLASAELEAFPATNINTEVNNQSVRISTFEKEDIELDPTHPDFQKWNDRLVESRKSANKQLKVLIAEGKAREEKTYYLSLSIGKRENQPTADA